jgi:hypothetical protein
MGGQRRKIGKQLFHIAAACIARRAFSLTGKSNPDHQNEDKGGVCVLDTALDDSAMQKIAAARCSVIEYPGTYESGIPASLSIKSSGRVILKSYSPAAAGYPADQPLVMKLQSIRSLCGIVKTSKKLRNI